MPIQALQMKAPSAYRVQSLIKTSMRKFGKKKNKKNQQIFDKNQIWKSNWKLLAL